MNMAVVQVRVDDELKNQASLIYESLGMDISTAVRMFLKKTIIEKGIPFDTKLDESKLNFELELQEMRRISEENGNADMTWKEINEIIKKARIEKEKKWNIMQ